VHAVSPTITTPPAANSSRGRFAETAGRRGTIPRRTQWGSLALLGVVCLGILYCSVRWALPQSELHLSLVPDAAVHSAGDLVTLTVVLSSTGAREMEVYDDISQNVSLRRLTPTEPFVLTQRHGPTRRIRLLPGKPAEFRIVGSVEATGEQGRVTINFGPFGSSCIEPPARLALVARFFPCESQGSEAIYSNQIVIHVQPKGLPES
jgi:hypothetical protein